LRRAPGRAIENPNVRRTARCSNSSKGPDFPTGGIVVEDRPPSPKPTRPGRGGFRLRARWEKEEGRGTYQIVVTEIPYQVQKAKLIERIAELLEQKKLPLLDDVRDESAEDVRIVLDAQEPRGRAGIC
jgi:topoisomerase IV subunit A